MAQSNRGKQRMANAPIHNNALNFEGWLLPDIAHTAKPDSSIAQASIRTRR